MVVNIINSIVESRMGYRDDFCVPDGLLLARSCGEAEDMIQIVIEVAGECGLNNISAYWNSAVTDGEII